MTFLLSALGRKLIFGAVIAASLTGGFFYLKSKFYNQGFNAALAAVEKQDARAIGAAEAARKKVQACRESEGVWNIETGACDK